MVGVEGAAGGKEVTKVNGRGGWEGENAPRTHRKRPPVR